jgi:Tfp pilus assembly protein PilE
MTEQHTKKGLSIVGTIIAIAVVGALIVLAYFKFAGHS